MTESTDGRAVATGGATMKVLVALNDSMISLRAAHEAGRLFPDAQFFVLNVSDHLVPWVMADYGTVYPMHLTDLPIDGLSADELASLAETAGIEDPALIAASGDPAAVICTAADEHDVDVIVVGSHDKGMLRRLFEPSVAHAVVQGTYRPVLVVSGDPPSEES